MKKLMMITLAALTMGSVNASTIGVSTHPFGIHNRVFTTESNSYLSNGSGAGLTAKYYHRFNNKVNLDAGFGITDGDRASKFSVGSEVEIFPDYGTQPRVSVKGIVETENFDGDRVNTFGFAPIASKGLSLWGNEAFPFVSLPVKVHLNQDTNEHETATALAAGITGRLPIQGYDNLVGNIEANMSLKNSYTGLVMGISLPIQ